MEDLFFLVLCCRLDIGMEDLYFSEGFQFLAENLSGEDFAYPPSQAGLEAAQDHKGEYVCNNITTPYDLVGLQPFLMPGL